VFRLFSSRRLLAALSFIVTIAAAILAVQLYGQLRTLFARYDSETILLVISLVGVVLEDGAAITTRRPGGVDNWRDRSADERAGQRTTYRAGDRRNGWDWQSDRACSGGQGISVVIVNSNAEKVKPR
jgi:hypothetical protein